jgi:aquaporin TIP
MCNKKYYVEPITSKDWTLKMLVMEFLGTFAICYVGGLAVMMSNLGKLDLTGVAFANWFVYSFMIWAGAGISGANYNGAVTLALMSTRHLHWVKGLLYLSSQFNGALLAGMVLGGFLRMYSRDPLVFKDLTGYPHANIDRFGYGTCFIVELVATFFLVFIFYATAVVDRPEPKDPKAAVLKRDTHVYSLTIGGALAMAILSIGPITGAALNPWRVIGPAFATQELFSNHYLYAWIYYVGCPLGGLLSALLWRFCFMRKTKEEVDQDKADAEEAAEDHDQGADDEETKGLKNNVVNVDGGK